MWHFLDDFGRWHLNLGGANRLTVTPTGNVGIGSTNPSSRLEVVTSGGTAVYGSSSTGNGVVALSTSNAGIYASSPSTAGYFYGSNGTGIYAEGLNTGVYAVGGSSYPGAGVKAAGGYYGVDANGTHNGVFASMSGNDYAIVAFGILTGGGLYASGKAGNYAGFFVGDFAASGTKSAAVKFDNGEYHMLYAQESPENWFEDFGTVQVVNGLAVINIDPTFAQTVNTTVEYHVFLTPGGDCRGLYVTNKTPASFEIRELQNGKSYISASYRIVAKRKGYENLRLARLAGPTPEEMVAQQAKHQAEMVKEKAEREQEQLKMEAERKQIEEQKAKMEQELKGTDKK